jgi:hypothetical protein
MDHLETVAFLGRTHILIDFDRKNKEQYQGNWQVVDPPLANGWRSVSRFDRELHLPCFDVDILPSKKVGRYLNVMMDAMEEYTAESVVASYFPGAEWVPSSTEGHFHVYSNTPIDWPAYEGRLRHLSELNIIEAGYYRSASARMGTHVRKPGVKKEVPPPDMVGDWETHTIDWKLPSAWGAKGAAFTTPHTYRQAQDQLAIFHERYKGQKEEYVKMLKRMGGN